MDEVTTFGYLASLTTRSDGVTVGFAIGVTTEYKSASADGVLKKADIG